MQLKQKLRLISGLIILAGFLILDFYLINIILYPPLQSISKKKIQQATGLNCSFDGVYLSFPAALKIYNLELKDNSGQSLLSASELRVTPSFSSIVFGERGTGAISSIDAKEMVFTMVNGVDGWIYPQLKRATKAVAPRKPAGNKSVTFRADGFVLALRQDTAESRHRFETVSSRLESDTVKARVINKGESADITLSRKNGSTAISVKSDRVSLSPVFALLGKKLPLENLAYSGIMNISATESKQNIQAAGSIEISSISHRYISSTSISNLMLDLKLKALRTGSLVEISESSISLGKEPVAIEGTVSGSRSPVVDLRLSFNNFSYDRAVSGLPKSLYPVLDNLRMDGSITGTFSLHLDTARPKTLQYSFDGKATAPKVISLGKGIEPDMLKYPFVHTVRRPDGFQQTFMVGAGNNDYAPLASIPKSLTSAVLISEDGSFFSHSGFSKRHIRDSIIQNIEAGRVVRGASTISMQLAKNLYLTGEKSMSRKFQETIITLALEQALDKNRMLEIYLNIVEWGNGIYGISQASKHYFGKHHSALLPEESAFLATILPNPRRNWPQNPLHRISTNWLGYVHHLLCLMYRRGDVTIEELHNAGVPDEKIQKIALSGRPVTTLELPVEDASSEASQTTD